MNFLEKKINDEENYTQFIARTSKLAILCITIFIFVLVIGSIIAEFITEFTIIGTFWRTLKIVFWIDLGIMTIGTLWNFGYAMDWWDDEGFDY